MLGSVLWLPIPFLGLYDFILRKTSIEVAPSCGDFLCEPNILGWAVIVFNIFLTLTVYYCVAALITRWIYRKR